MTTAKDLVQFNINSYGHTENDIDIVANLLAEYSQKLESLYNEFKELLENNTVSFYKIFIAIVSVFSVTQFLHSILPISKVFDLLIYLIIISIISLEILTIKNQFFNIKNIKKELIIMSNKFERLVKLGSQLQEHFFEEESVRSIQFDLRLLDAERVLRKVRMIKHPLYYLKDG